MNDKVIKADKVGKKFLIDRAQRESYTALRDVLSQGVKNLFRKGVRNGMVKEDFWALRDVSFEVSSGEALGIIGRNGAGKSTLLKILSRITEPSSGRIELCGRVASLLEVGTGFHPELTGRENIYLNGAILGMGRQEIKRKFDEIVEFSGVERFLDTPVKRFSSGMYVRLAFAVAAHLEPEILVIDEVLAVGDMDFQKKCLGKMQEVSSKEGRTVLFVSHNMTAIKQFCNRCLLLNNGKVEFDGSTEDAIKMYQNDYNASAGIVHKGDLKDAIGNENIRILRFEVLPLKGNILRISSGFEFILEFYNHRPGINLAITFELRSLDETIVFHHGHWVCQENSSKQGVYSIRSKINPNVLNAGNFKFTLIFAENLNSVLFFVRDVMQFEIMNEILAGNSQQMPGVLRPPLKYEVSLLSEKK